MSGKKGGLTRLRRELQSFMKDPPPHIIVSVHEKDMLEWHYLIEGPADTPYAGGWYHGKLRFPPEYPFKPPGIMMVTPSGRFEPNMRLCLSMSDYHPETWNPAWSVATVLTGLLSFMTGNEITTGAVETTEEDKRRLARASLEFNLKNPVFTKMFPDFCDAARRGDPLDLTRAGGGGAAGVSIAVTDDDSSADGPSTPGGGGSSEAAASPSAGGEGGGRGSADTQGANSDSIIADAAAAAPPRAAGDVVSAAESAAAAAAAVTSAGSTAQAGAVQRVTEGVNSMAITNQGSGGGGLSVGDSVEIYGLVQAAQYNGIRCDVVGVAADGRLRVRLAAEGGPGAGGKTKELLMRPDNLKRLN